MDDPVTTPCPFPEADHAILCCPSREPDAARPTEDEIARTRELASEPTRKDSLRVLAPETSPAADRGAFRVGPGLDGIISWWVCWQMPHYNPPGTRLPTQEEADIMERLEWKCERAGDTDRLRLLLNGTVPHD